MSPNRLLPWKTLSTITPNGNTAHRKYRHFLPLACRAVENLCRTVGQCAVMLKPLTPKELFDHYALLPNEAKLEFIKLVGQMSTGEVPWLIVNELPVSERNRFNDFMFEEVTWLYFPFLISEARKLAKEHPNLGDEEFNKELNERMKQANELYNKAIGERERARPKRGSLRE